MLTTGLTGLAAANEALATFNTDNPDVASDLDGAQTTYEGLTDAGSDDLTTDSAALSAAYRSDTETSNATALTDAQEALADANTLIAEVAGLTDAVAAEAAALTATADADAAAVVAQTASDVAEGAWGINSLVDEFITSSNNATGVLTAVTVGASSPITAATTLTLTVVDGDTDLVSLADADVAWDADANCIL